MRSCWENAADDAALQCFVAFYSLDQDENWEEKRREVRETENEKERRGEKEKWKKKGGDMRRRRGIRRE